MMIILEKFSKNNFFLYLFLFDTASKTDIDFAKNIGMSKEDLDNLRVSNISRIAMAEDVIMYLQVSE